MTAITLCQWRVLGRIGPHLDNSIIIEAFLKSMFVERNPLALGRPRRIACLRWSICIPFLRPQRAESRSVQIENEQAAMLGLLDAQRSLLRN